MAIKIKKLENGVIVIIRKNGPVKKIEEIFQSAKKYKDISFECEKPKNPLEFERTSYAKVLTAKPLWENLRVSPNHIYNLFGEPTRICSQHVEWALRIPERNVVKIVINNKGVSIHGFNLNKNVEKWIERLLNS